MEEYHHEAYLHLENVEALFKRINRFGNEYNYCFGTFVPPSAFTTALGAVGALIEAGKNRNKKHVSGYFINKNEREICLIPVILDDNQVMQIDMDGHVVINPEDMESIKIKSEDFIYRRIIITLNDKTKYVMTAAKRMKGADYHERNLKEFVHSVKS